MRWLLLAAIGLMVSGCYESGEMLLDPQAARQPVTRAQDWKYTNSAGTFHATLTPRRDGWYDYSEAAVSGDGSEDSPDQHRVLLNFLDRVQGADIYVLGFWNEDEHAFMYGLAVMRPDINWRIVMPNCDRFTNRGDTDEVDLMAAQSASASRPFGQAGCYFTSAASLKNAMYTLVYDKRFWSRVKTASN